MIERMHDHDPDHERAHKFGLRGAVLAFAASCGLLFGACTDDGDDGVPAAGKDACEDYCDHAQECNDETDKSECMLDCQDSLGDCQADEQSQAIEDLEKCAKESCDDFLGCSIAVGLQCTFGV
jgi:hypothetical protein